MTVTVDIGRKTVDCSSNNGIPNVRAYRNAGHEHLIRKVTEGVSYHWYEGDSVTDQCHDLDIHVGHYHWLREDADPSDQARFFVNAVKPHLGPPATTFNPVPNGDWLMNDAEQTAGVTFPGDQKRAWQITTFNAMVRKLLPNYLMAVYTGNWYLDGRPQTQNAVRPYPVIISGYIPNLPPNPYNLNYMAWQFTDAAHVDGFSGPVDYNVFLGVAQEKDWFEMATEKDLEQAVKKAIAPLEHKVEALLQSMDGLDGNRHRVEILAAMGAKDIKLGQARKESKARWEDKPPAKKAPAKPAKK